MVVDEGVDQAAGTEQPGEILDVDVDGAVRAERIAVGQRRLAEGQDVGAPDGVQFGAHRLLRQAAGVAGDASEPVVDGVGQDQRLPRHRAGEFGETALLLDRILGIGAGGHGLQHVGERRQRHHRGVERRRLPIDLGDHRL